jgi:mannose-6-phosphate isomerase-like protein (cupin superfamily)
MMQAFEIPNLLENAPGGAVRYHEFLRVPQLSLGLYGLKAGELDPQSPHYQDEVYYVIAGRGKLRVNDHVQEVAAGSIVYVEAHAPHRFVDIEEDLEILVFFAPAEAG